MDLIPVIHQRFHESMTLHEQVLAGHAPTIAAMAEALTACLRAGGKVLLAGNGGSAADAQHLAAELVNRFLQERPALPAIALTTDTSILTATANDRAFAEVFSRQVEALGRPGDALLLLSTSGPLPQPPPCRAGRPRPSHDSSLPSSAATAAASHRLC
jgi:phosphoheptose isomerase (EC 5.3.1.-)